VNSPHNVTAASVLMVGNVSGTFRIQGLPLPTPEEMDAAVKKGVDFHPPGH
jgi:hypothetical protein